METVIDDFWDTLTLEENPNYSYSDYESDLNLFISDSTKLGYLRVTTIQYPDISDRYVVMLTNREKATERDRELVELNNVPGHISTMRVYNTLKSALDTHCKALNKLNRLGY